MDVITDNASSPGSGPALDTEAIPPHAQNEQHSSDPPESSQNSARALWVRSRMARSWAYGSESREAKICELQESIDNGTYYVTAEQIADKMLRRILQPEHT